MKDEIYQPKVSIVTVVLNNVNLIESTIHSVLNQTYDNIEFIVIDGGSTDGTIHIIDKYRDTISIIVSESDKGLYDAMNKGTNKSTGEWIIYMNSGDVFYDENVLKNIFFNRPNVQFANLIYSDFVTVNSFGHLKKTKARPLSMIWLGAPTSHQSIIVKTKIAQENLFDTNYKINADYDFIYKTYIKYGDFLYLEDVTISQCIGYEGVSKSVNPKFTLKEHFQVSSKYSSILKICLLGIISMLKYFYALLKNI